MTTTTLKTRDLGEITFRVQARADGTSGYVFASVAGGDWRQPCEGGGWLGSTLMATPATLKAKARRWNRQRREASR